MAPLLRTTLAARGHTPELEQRAKQRDKVSVAAAIWKTPRAGLVRLAYQTFPNQHINNERYAFFIEDLLTQRLRGVPVIILHDGGNMHRGDPVDGVMADVDWLFGFVSLPSYAPELNPVEQLWNWLKYDELANFAPRDVPDLDRAVHRELFGLHRNQPRLRTFLASTPLRW